MNEYNPKLAPGMDLNDYFSKKEFDVLEIGSISLPSGKLVAGDPLGFLPYSETIAFKQTFPTGRYPVCLSVFHSEEYGDRYLAAKLTLTQEKPVQFQLALKGKERAADLKEGEFFGIWVTTGLAALCDAKTQKQLQSFAAAWHKEHPDGNLYDDYFAALFEESYRTHPKYQRPGGDWAYWSGGKGLDMLMFNSGFGDGVYPCYLGYDRKGKLCCAVLQFISPAELEGE